MDSTATSTATDSSSRSANDSPGAVLVGDEGAGDHISAAAYEAELVAQRAARKLALGFVPQKETFCNQWLPYADALDDESQRMLRLIKENLARAVACRELAPGTCFWVSRLSTYIKLYGLKFSLEDHVHFVKLLLSLLMQPFLEPTRLGRICAILCHLLRKSKRISPEHLQIEWRPLYKLVLIYVDKKSTKGQFYRFYSPPETTDQRALLVRNLLGGSLAHLGRNSGASELIAYAFGGDAEEDMSIENNLLSLIDKAAPYFPSGTTQQIMDEIFPQLYPLDTGKYCDTLAIISLFLSYTEDYDLWLPHVLNLWATYQNPGWSTDIMTKLSTLALYNVGRIDWEPHLPMIYARILRSMSLPVYYKTMKGSRSQTLAIDSIADFIACTLGPRSTSQSHLTHLLGTLESFVHPANTGKWTQKIGEMVARIAEKVIKRLIRERYRPHPWKWQTPADARLTDACVTTFVRCMQPFAFQELYSRVSGHDVCFLFRQLAELRPELIIPGVIERVYVTLDSLTEPHRLTAALQCLVSVARSLVSGHNGYTAGRTHVVPMLFAMLPGIDPNDFRKTTVTLDFLTSFALMIPIIDCSQAAQFYDDLTDEEALICDQTAEFEGFVLQYLDRVFAVIEASAHQTIRLEQHSGAETRSKYEALADASLLASMQGLLGQCSAPIVTAAAQKLIGFVQTHLFETNVAAPMVGSLVRVFARSAAAAEMQKTFFPWLLDAVHTFIDEHDDCATAEKHSDELQYYLTLLECYLRGSPTSVLSCADDVMGVFKRIRHFRSVRTTRKANTILATVLATVSTMQAEDVRTSPESFERPLRDWLPIRHWGEKSRRPIVWYVPGEAARATCERILHRYLPEYVERFDRFVAGDLEMRREELERDGSAVFALLRCANFLPGWADVEPPVFGAVESCVERTGAVRLTLGMEHLVIRMPDGENVRLALVRCLGALQEKIFRDCEDDIKTLQTLVNLWERVHMQRNSMAPFKVQLKAFASTKRFQDHLLCQRPLDIRAVVATRVLIQQDAREQLAVPQCTATHLVIMRHLLRCSTSRYAAVRRIAQLRLFGMMQKFPQAYRLLLEDVCEVLALDANAEHDRFKGALYVVYGNRLGRMVIQNNWSTVERLWLALLRTNLSEKPSVVRLMDAIVQAIKDEFPTVTIALDMPDECVALALALRPADAREITAEEMAVGRERQNALTARNREQYDRLLQQILDVTRHGNSLHWRYGRMASVMINSLLHPQQVYPVQVVEYAVNNLINESIEERKMAVKMIRNVLPQHKREHTKVPLDLRPLARPLATDRPAPEGGAVWRAAAPGMRADNRFLQYDVATVPRSQAEWDEQRYVQKPMGYFGWPSGYKVYAPSDRQPSVHRKRDELSPSERVLYDFFVDAANVGKLVEFAAMEEKRGEEKFYRMRMLIVKGLCSAFGPVIVEQLLPHVERLIKVKTNLESSHRCAAELMAGILRGVKHWPYAETAAMYARVVPLVRLALASITVETDEFWGTCFATSAENMDPQRQWWLHEVLLEDPLREERSFVDCIRIYCLQGPFNQHVWRMNTVSQRLLDYLRPYLYHSFQNVRERLGSLLINIFEADLEFRDANDPECPRIKDFIAETLVRLECLNGEMPDGVQKRVKKDDKTAADVGAAAAGDDDPMAVVKSAAVIEYEGAVRLFKTVCHWITGIINRSTNGNRAEFFAILPLACRLERSEQDDELAESCSALMAMIAQALTLADVMPVALATITSVSESGSWSARVAILDVMQVLVFNNMPIVLARTDWVQRVQAIVLRLMEDPVLEVRDKASQVLCGLLHCAFLPATDKLLELFKRRCRTQVPKHNRRRGGAGTTVAVEAVELEAESMRKRHMGVMGLCAFIAAYPYEIPDFVPEVFEHLGAHLNDPQPIPSTIRLAVGNFKRTHHDNWATHKQKFTENQLEVLSDLTIPPSYYA